MHLLSLQTGTPRTAGTPGASDPIHRQFTSAIWKTPVAGPVHVTALGLVGDTVADRRHHGGPDQALLAYGAPNYAAWLAEEGWQLHPGDFGENLVVSEATEDTVCVGDVWAVGDAVRVQVTKPREPCMTLARRHQRGDLVKVVKANGRHGWYLRVLSEGSIEAGMPVTLLERPHPDWTARRTGQVMWGRDATERAALAGVAALAADWRERLAKER